MDIIEILIDKERYGFEYDHEELFSGSTIHFNSHTETVLYINDKGSAIAYWGVSLSKYLDITRRYKTQENEHGIVNSSSIYSVCHDKFDGGWVSADKALAKKAGLQPMLVLPTNKKPEKMNGSWLKKLSGTPLF